MRLRRVAGVLAAAVLTTACALVLDVEDVRYGNVDAAAAATLDGTVADAVARDVMAAGTEDCTNGIDDDANGLADCADPKCQGIGYECSAVPEGWRGPYAVTSGALTAAPCTAPFDAVGVEGNDGLTAPAASCTCSCGALTGATCSATLLVTTVANCASGGVNVSVTRACAEATPGSFTQVTAIGGGIGGCAPSAAPQEPVTWTSTIRACGASAPLPVGGCAGAARCAPPVPPGFAIPHCMAHDGDLACPADYPKKRIAYADVDDTRACPDCGCQAPPCEGVTEYLGSGCTGTGLAPGATCSTTGSTPARSARLGAGDAKCTTVTGTPTGRATPARPTTICCSG